jgi:hypothetical protein
MALMRDVNACTNSLPRHERKADDTRLTPVRPESCVRMASRVIWQSPSFSPLTLIHRQYPIAYMSCYRVVSLLTIGFDDVCDNLHCKRHSSQPQTSPAMMLHTSQKSGVLPEVIRHISSYFEECRSLYEVA